ncbi:sigma-54 dependent transcriptional regulator [Nitratireductor sp. L1-7-SE]|uniref:DNA-binding transcriptional regulator NtrC n=1 Tax=Nitratireductor rhodophyticola TaxID=2854036 RepID=A0ABS7RDN0_9HYPH|nr:sigma-54 dependent transcriptional regulator [Nitratireductor rhodophyticola]MBY8917708.1 sigma-54 dependent transcriptional regulator [Nitratireductor rhodophyticola]MBY8922419.1 sigma-54 dependent transcriptional regulator [Nitratireductor rhodophyticola]
MSEAVLIVDDDPVQRRLLQAAVEKLGHTPLLAENGQEALGVLERAEQAPRTIVLDLVMPQMSGLEMLERLRGEGSDIPVIVQTSRGSIDTAVEAMRAGAFDFIVKPVAPARLGAAIKNALRVSAMETRQRRGGRPAEASSLDDLVTNSPSMARVIMLGQKAAASDIPILIEGESGVGKEVIARAIQSESRRRRKPFITVNCGAIPDTLVESILFGHEKGAFTGATEKRIGKFAEADTGTLFLDEIGDLPLDVQVKLLRAVQQGEVDTVGGRGTQKVDIRLISATNQNLIERVKEGRFREDLFYRLNVFPIMVPPLRERRDDIPLLVQAFIARFSDSASNRITGISRRALALLESYDWPGNIRQLENAVFRAVVLCETSVLDTADFPQILAQVEGIDPYEAQTGTVSADDSPAAALPTDRRDLPHREAPTVQDLPGSVATLDEDGNVRPLEEIESDVIRFALDHYRGQMSEIARRLGIGRSTLYRKLKDMGIDPAERPRAKDD